MCNFAPNPRGIILIPTLKKIEFINGFVVKIARFRSDKMLKDSIKLVAFLVIDESSKQNFYFIFTLIKIGSGLVCFKRAPCKIENNHIFDDFVNS